MVERGGRLQGAGRWVAATLLWVMLVATALPGAALASSGDGAAAGGPGDGAGTAAESSEPGWFFTVAYYARYASEQVRLWASRDPAGDAALAAAFAEQRATRLAGLAPGSTWFERLATDIAGYLRLAQQRLVEARAAGAETDRAVAALEDAVARVAELPQRVATGDEEQPTAVGEDDDQGTQAAGGSSDDALAVPPSPTGESPTGEGAGAGQDQAATAPGSPDGTGAGDAAARAGDGTGATGTGVEAGNPEAVNPDAEAAEPGTGAGAGALDEALQAAAEAELVAGSVAMMEPAEITALRDQGYGYGQIALLYATAQAIRLTSGQQVTVLDVAAQLAALAGAGEGGQPGSQPATGDGGTAAPGEGEGSGTPSGEAGSAAGEEGAAAAGSGEAVTGSDTVAVNGDATAPAIAPAVKVKAFGRTLNELLALYGIHRRDVKPGRWVAAAHRATVQPPAADEPREGEPGGTEAGDAEGGNLPAGDAEVSTPGDRQPDEPATEDSEEALREDHATGDEDALVAAADDDEDGKDADRAPAQGSAEDKPGRGHGQGRSGDRDDDGSGRGRGAARSNR